MDFFKSLFEALGKNDFFGFFSNLFIGLDMPMLKVHVCTRLCVLSEITFPKIQPADARGKKYI